MKRNIRKPQIFILFITIILLISSCVPKVGTHTLKINSDPERINIIIGDTPEEVNVLSNDNEVLSTPFSKSFPFGKEVIVKVIGNEPTETDEEIYQFDHWSDGSYDNPRAINITNDIQLTAKAKKMVKVKVSSEPSNIVKFEESGWYEIGEELILTAPEVDGYEFIHWKTNDEVKTDNPLTLQLEEPTKIEAVYALVEKDFALTISTLPAGLDIILDNNTKISPFTISVEENSEHTIEFIDSQEKNESDFVEGVDTRYSFDAWNDNSTSNPRTVIIEEDIEYTAKTDKEYKVDIITSPEGIANIEGSGWYEENSTLSFSPIEIEGYDFSHWQVNGEVINETSLELTVNEPKKVIAVFESQGYSVTFNTEPTGLNMTVNEQNIITPKSISSKIGEVVNFEIPELQEKNETIYIDGIDTRYSFLKWNDEDTSLSREITVYGDLAFTAFMKTEYFVDVSSEITEINGTGWYEKEKQIQLTAPEANGYEFDQWIVNDSETINSISLSLTVNKPMKIVANYKKEVQKFSLSVNSSPQGLTVLVDEETLLTPIIINFEANSTHEFSMVDKQEKDVSEYVPGNDTRYLFEKWNDGSTEISRTISLDSDKSFAASTIKYFKVETGTIPSGIAEINGAGWYENNSSISLKAEDIDDYNFLHWQINGTTSDGDATKTATIDKPISIKAVYNTFPMINLENITVEKGQKLQLKLNEFSSDPDNDSLTYHLVSGSGTIDQDTYSLDTSTNEAREYSVEIRVEDGRGGEASDSFTINITEANNPPAVPSSPTPGDDSTNQETSLTLSWQCSDPDNDSLAYDLYFGTNEIPEIFEESLTEKSFTVNSLNESTTYYWKIVAEDSNGAIIEGPVWSFSTKEPPPADGVDLTGPVYSGDILLVNNESESSNKEYTGTLSENNYLPEGDYLPENLEREAYMVDPELPLPDNADPNNLAKPQDFTVASLGDTKTFWVRDFSTNDDYQITATLQYSGEHCEVWAENPEEITSSKAVELGSEFDDSIYPLITNYFYTPSDVNKDGKVSILAMDIQDNFDNTGAYVGGYFYSKDLFSVTGSNKMEIFYIDTYPTMHYPKTNEIDVSRAFSTLAHEFQHMVNFNRNYIVEYGNPMPTWLNEGLSLAAEHLYKGVLTSRISYYNKSSNIKNGHSLLYWGDNGDTLANYSLSYLFLQYIRTQTGSNNVFKDILLDNKNDSEAVTNALSKYGISKAFGDLMTDFRLALLIKDSSGPYGFNGDSSFSNLSTQLYTGSAKDIRGGTAFFKAIDGSYEDPGDSGSSIQYAGIAN
jgi:hypothetical protein